MTKKCDENCNNNCSHDCSSCGKNGNCNHKTPEKLKPNKNSSIKKVIAVVSGKGGVGKSLTCSILANKFNKDGAKVGILDADVTGPSIPKIYGVKGMLTATDDALDPKISKNGIKIVSTNLILDNPESPVAWRGPVVSGAISQFFNMTNWGDLDILFIDMPPGTSDVFLTIMQTLPIDGIICVSTPQDLVEMIVGKAINLANMMNIKTIGLAENMSYFECDSCKKKHEIFGKSKVEYLSKKFEIENFDKVPMNTKFADLCDNGEIEKLDSTKLLNNCFNAIKNI